MDPCHGVFTDEELLRIIEACQAQEPLPLRWWHRLHSTSGAVLLTIAIAQIVGLAKLEAAIRLTTWITDPLWLRAAVYGMGATLTVVVAWANVVIVRRLSP